MSFLSKMEAELPPGFRFSPKDDELVCDYLAAMKAAGGRNRGLCGLPVMIDIDLNKVEPWQIPETARVGGKEWYFFSLRDRKYRMGQRTNRATVSGYWKATGKDRIIRRRGIVVGMRKTLVFYQGRAPKGKKTEWVMHEFRMEGGRAQGRDISDHHLHNSSLSFDFKEDWVLCRVFYKSRGISPNPSTDPDSFPDDDSGSSSLPPLTDTYITFEQQPPPLMEGIEQVPCFSNLPQRNTESHHLHGFSELVMNTHLNQFSYNNLLINPARTDPVESKMYADVKFSCDKKILKSVLDQLTNNPQFVVNEGSSSESYCSNLTDQAAVGLPSIWNTF